MTFMSKIVELAVSQQHHQYLADNDLLPRYQSSYRRHHSTETAMLRVLFDVLTVADAQQVTLLGLLDLSAPFDCVDRQLLLQRLRRDFGFTDTVLAWTTSFVTGRTQQVLYKDCLFSCSACPVWGPTGICPWPHTVCLVYGRNRPKSAESLLSIGSSFISMPTTATFTSPLRQQVKFTVPSTSFRAVFTTSTSG